MMKFVEFLALSYDTTLTESLPPDADAGAWIKDFVGSNNPKFKGKTPKKRREMAIAAYYASKK